MDESIEHIQQTSNLNKISNSRVEIENLPQTHTILQIIKTYWNKDDS